MVAAMQKSSAVFHDSTLHSGVNDRKRVKLKANDKVSKSINGPTINNSCAAKL